MRGPIAYAIYLKAVLSNLVLGVDSRVHAEKVARVGLIAAEFVRLANVLLSRSCGNPALITYPPPVIPSDLSFGYLSAALKSPVKIPILGEPVQEYSQSSVQRRQQMRSRQLDCVESISLHGEKLKRFRVLVINDINVTAAQQTHFHKYLSQETPACVHYLYLVDVDKKLGRNNPELEYELNNSAIHSREEFSAILNSEKMNYTSRCIARLFSYELSEFKNLLDSISTKLALQIHSLIQEEKKYGVVYADAKFDYLKNVCTQKVINFKRINSMYDLNHKIPIIDKDHLDIYHQKSIEEDKTDPRFHEPLINLSTTNLAFESYFAQDDGQNPPYGFAIKGSSRQGWLRKSFIDRIIEANTFLKPYDVEVFIFDAYRSVKCQRGLWAYFYQRAQQELATDDDELCTKYVVRYIKDPRTYNFDKPKGFHIHLTGAAIDASLRKISNGEFLNMGSRFEEINDISVSDYFERLLLKGEIDENDERLHNRRLMDWALSKAGLQNHPILFWHYDWGDEIYIKVKMALSQGQQTKAWYGYVEDPEDADLPGDFRTV
jgi:D-alanyl-D-alanine dipeptidase